MDFLNSFAYFLFLIRIRAVLSQAAECIILDPTNPSSFDTWINCGDQRQLLTRMEYNVDIDLAPYGSDSLFVFANSGSGSFCMESPYAVTLSENLFSEVVYRTISRVQTSPSTFQINIYGTEDESLVTYSKEEDGNWSFMEGWMMPISVYKVRKRIWCLKLLFEFLNCKF